MGITCTDWNREMAAIATAEQNGSITPEEAHKRRGAMYGKLGSYSIEALFIKIHDVDGRVYGEWEICEPMGPGCGHELAKEIEKVTRQFCIDRNIVWIQDHVRGQNGDPQG